MSKKKYTSRGDQLAAIISSDWQGEPTPYRVYRSGDTASRFGVGPSSYDGTGDGCAMQRVCRSLTGVMPGPARAELADAIRRYLPEYDRLDVREFVDGVVDANDDRNATLAAAWLNGSLREIYPDTVDQWPTEPDGNTLGRLLGELRPLVLAPTAECQEVRA